jgi:dTDP-4-amino-4,6-dideoxygalactose transaminase/acetyltransferase-like isoleucine patch superfamily enzyme
MIFIHETAKIDERVDIGADTKIWQFSHILKNSRVGKGCNIGQNVVVGPDVVVGDNCKIQNNVSVYKGVTLEDEVFCGPSCVFTNLSNPRSAIRRMDEIRPTLVKKGASLGANCTIVCGVIIGEYSFVGAGTVVTKDVADHALVMGNPARQTGWMCACGEKIGAKMVCLVCGKDYHWLEGSDFGDDLKDDDLKDDDLKDDDLKDDDLKDDDLKDDDLRGYSSGEDGSKDDGIAFVDLAAQQRKILPLIEANIRAVLQHGRYIMGPEVKALEMQLADFVGVGRAVACSSGTDALILALMAYGIKKGDGVFTTPFTFAATAEAIRIVGAVPVFVDIDQNTFNMSVVKLESAVEKFKLNNPAGFRPIAIMPVDLFGLPCDYNGINKIARENSLLVIEDAAQSLGAEYKGRMAGRLGDIGCTSFFPAKPLGCYGDGGAIFTNSDEIAERLDSIRVHGKGSDKYDNVRLGMNGRLDTLQAAILLAKMTIFPGEIQKRRAAAKRYGKMIAGLQDRADIVVPKVFDKVKSAWAQYSLLAKDGAMRSLIREQLKEKGVPTAVYYPAPLHLLTAYKDLGYKRGDFPVAEDIADRIFSIPMHAYLGADVFDRVRSALK